MPFTGFERGYAFCVQAALILLTVKTAVGPLLLLIAVLDFIQYSRSASWEFGGTTSLTTN